MISATDTKHSFSLLLYLKYFSSKSTNRDFCKNMFDISWYLEVSKINKTCSFTTLERSKNVVSLHLSSFIIVSINFCKASCKVEKCKQETWIWKNMSLCKYMFYSAQITKPQLFARKFCLLVLTYTCWKVTLK